MDFYGRELANRLPVPPLPIRIDHCSMDTFRPARWGWTALRGALDDPFLVGALRRTRYLLHLTHHHLARYGPLAGYP
jgi:hypothetical protein